MAESYTNNYIRGIKEDSTAENMIEAYEEGRQSVHWLAGSLLFQTDNGSPEQCEKLCRIIKQFVKSEGNKVTLIRELNKRVRCPCLDTI